MSLTPLAAFEQRWHFQLLSESPGKMMINIALPDDLPFSGNSCLSLVNPLSLAESSFDYEGVYLLLLLLPVLDCNTTRQTQH